MINESTSGLPEGWASATLEQLVPHDGLFTDGDWVESKDQDPHGEVRLIQLADVGDQTFNDKSAKFLKLAKANELACSFLQEGDILVARMPDPLGRSCIFPLKGDEKFVTVVDVCIVRVNAKQISNKFLSYWINSPHIRQEIDKLKSGSTRKRISRKNFSNVVFPIAPYLEQIRIVEKIEELFSELDKGVESLKTAREQLKVYRQSLLRAAFEGKLSEEWRKDNAGTLQPAEMFLGQIRKEREDRHHEQLKAWEGEVEKWQAAGKKGKKPAKPKPMKKIDSPSPEELEALGALPLTWCWAKIGDVSSVGTGVTPLKSRPEFYEKGDIPWVTSGALNKNFVSEASGYVTRTALAETNLRLYPKHTLLMAMYGEGKTRGKCSELLLPATTNQAVAAMVQSGIEEESRPFLKWFLIKNYADIRRKSSGGVQPNLNLGIVENTFFPLCSIAEMREIDSELQRQLSVIEENERDIDAQLDKSSALRQSILKKAFRGQLVKQDPADESASSLLRRIAQQKEEAVALAKKAKAAVKKKPKRKAKQ